MVGGTLALLIVIAAIMVAVRPRPSSVANTNNHPAPLAGPGSMSNITPYDPAKDPNANSGQFNAPPVQRDAQLLYLVIECYPRQEMAVKAARFLADHGVDVTIEPSKGSFWLISTRGFAKAESREAQAFQRKVIEIGKEKFEGHTRRISIFNSANFRHIARG